MRRALMQWTSACLGRRFWVNSKAWIRQRMQDTQPDEARERLKGRASYASCARRFQGDVSGRVREFGIRREAPALFATDAQCFPRRAAAPAAPHCRLPIFWTTAKCCTIFDQSAEIAFNPLE